MTIQQIKPLWQSEAFGLDTTNNISQMMAFLYFLTF